MAQRYRESDIRYQTQMSESHSVIRQGGISGINESSFPSVGDAPFRVIVMAKQKHLPALSAGTNIRKVPAENAEILALNSIITKARKLNLRFIATPYGKSL